MLQTGGICRSCLASLRLSQPGHPRLLARSLTSQATAATSSSAVSVESPALRPPRKSAPKAKGPVRRFRKHDPFPRSSPQDADQRHNKAQARARPPSRITTTSDVDHYSREVADLWDRFEELWKDPDAPPATTKSIDPEAFMSGRNESYHKQPPKDFPAHLQLSRNPQWKFSKASLLKSQATHLVRNTDPKRRPEEMRRFRKWKNHLEMCWKNIVFKKRIKRIAGGPRKPIRRLERLLEESKGDITIMATAWDKLPTEDKIRVWPNLMMSALHTTPDDVCDILEATYDPSVVPFYAVMDTVHFLARREHATLPSQVAPLQTRLDRLCQVVEILLARSPKDYIQFRQRTLFLLINGSNSKQLASLHNALIQYGHPLHAMTKLQIASRLAKDSSLKEQATDILGSLVQDQLLDINTPHGASICTSILMMEETDIDGDGLAITPAQLFNQLLELGLNPNLVTFTAIIRNLCLAKEINAAWEVYHVMLDHNIEPDIYVYSSLLNGAKLAQNFGSMRHLISIAISKNIRDPVFWNDLLHGIFLSALIEARRKGLKPPRVVPSFPLMLQAYAKVFTTEPLKPLLLVDVDRFIEAGLDQGRLAGWNFVAQLAPVLHELPPRGSVELLEPDGSTMAAMIIGYVKGISKPYDIIAFYSHFRRLLQSGEPSAVRLVAEQGTFVHDVIIKALCEHQGMLRVALDVISDMLRDANPNHNTASTAGRHPPPSVHTWSILLNGFMFQRQRQQGERILAMMRQRGAPPNLVTWNTLTAGHSRLQDVGKTVRSLQRLEADGHEADDFTFRAFSYLQNKKAALAQMERMVQQRKERQQAQAAARTAAMVSAFGDMTGDEMSVLESEVEEIARMMDDDPGESEDDGDGFDYDAEDRGLC